MNSSFSPPVYVWQCPWDSKIDAHAAGEIEPVAIRRIGPDLVFARIWKESGIPEVLRSVLKARHYEFDVERAIYLTVLHRLFASGSDRAAERWREDHWGHHTKRQKSYANGFQASLNGAALSSD